MSQRERSSRFGHTVLLYLGSLHLYNLYSSINHNLYSHDFSLQKDRPKILALHNLISAAAEVGFSAPHSTVNTVLLIKDVPIGMGTVIFVPHLLSATFIRVRHALLEQALYNSEIAST